MFLFFIAFLSINTKPECPALPPITTAQDGNAMTLRTTPANNEDRRRQSTRTTMWEDDSDNRRRRGKMTATTDDDGEGRQALRYNASGRAQRRVGRQNSGLTAILTGLSHLLHFSPCSTSCCLIAGLGIFATMCYVFA